jgi:hypothetical protein
MPLEKSASREAIGHNIAEMEASGHPHNQAIAAALDTARRAGAHIPRRAPGGQVPWFVRREASSMMHTGPIHSAVAGRTDHIPMHVPNGSYVLPADHVSGLGQGNTSAGHERIKHAFGPSGMLHPGMGAPRGHGGGGGGGLPTVPHEASTGLPSVFKAGGVTDGDSDGVPIMAAGGEHVLSPEEVAQVGYDTLVQVYGREEAGRATFHQRVKVGHRTLDAWVKSKRKGHIKTLQKLPGPAQD